MKLMEDKGIAFNLRDKEDRLRSACCNILTESVLDFLIDREVAIQVVAAKMSCEINNATELVDGVISVIKEAAYDKIVETIKDENIEFEVKNAKAKTE